MSNDLQTARLVALTMKRYDAHIEVLGTKGDAVKNSIARSRLKVAENNLNQACETVKKKGGGNMTYLSPAAIDNIHIANQKASVATQSTARRFCRGPHCRNGKWRSINQFFNKSGVAVHQFCKLCRCGK